MCKLCQNLPKSTVKTEATVLAAMPKITLLTMWQKSKLIQFERADHGIIVLFFVF